LKLGVRARLLLVSLGLVFVGGLAADRLVAGNVEALLTAKLREDLASRARLARLAASTPSTLPALVQALSESSGARVLIVDAQGKPVLGEAGLLAPSAAGLVRVELDVALEDGTTGRALLAQSREGVDQAVSQLRRVVWLGALLAAVAASAVSFLAARWITQVVDALATAARRMAAGEAQRTAVPPEDELGELGRAVNELAQSLFEALHGLRRERDLFRGVLEGMQEGVLVLDAQGRIEHFNPALREMLLLPGQLHGRTPLEVIRNSELQALLTQARGGVRPVLAELETVGLKPRRLLVQAATLPGGPGGLLASFVDVTEVRRLESMRRDFVANVSHELRTPVAAIRSAAETLRDAAQRDPPAAARFVDMIERNADRMRQLVDDLLELARIESRELHLKTAPVPLAPAVEQAFALLADAARRKRIHLSSELPEGLAVQADGRALEHVLTNLVDNAVKYCPPGARVLVRARSQGDRIHISVEDTGQGIEPRHLPRLFERFYRVDPGRSRDVGGTGLGLSIVKHLAESMEGEVSVESRVGQGSVFTVSLPAA